MGEFRRLAGAANVTIMESLWVTSGEGRVWTRPEWVYLGRKPNLSLK